jgi:hypothetical protein
MYKRLVYLLTLLASSLLVIVFNFGSAIAGERPTKSGYRVLPGVSQGALTIFPVIADTTYDTSGFITLDEGLRSGKVIVAEGGKLQGLIRGQRSRSRPVTNDAVNRLLLVNNSERPLLLLAGEIVTGGKQDRVVAKDRIVLPESEPVDLSVFCVEPGRWAEKTASFGGLSFQMAQPKVRRQAMANKDQQRVWDAVAESKVEVTAAAPRAAAGLSSTSSYAGIAQNEDVKRKLDDIAVPLERSYEKVMRELKNQNAVGVVVAVNGRILWADVFASPQLLQKYWTKLIRSYAAEAMNAGMSKSIINADDAQAFIDDMQGRRETAETEPDAFRHTEITGSGYRVFTLTSLLPKTGYAVHTTKMAEDTVMEGKARRMVRPQVID